MFTPPPSNPIVGDRYMDCATYISYIWDGHVWNRYNPDYKAVDPIDEHEFIPPTPAQLNKHPALKEVWEEFLIIKKLLGI